MNRFLESVFMLIGKKSVPKLDVLLFDHGMTVAFAVPSRMLFLGTFKFGYK